MSSPNTQQRAAFNTLPTYLIANSSQNFDLLFSLLESSETDETDKKAAFSLTQKVWDLLMQLPLNQGAVNRLRQLQATAPAAAVPSAPAVVGDGKAVSTPAPVVDWKSLLDPTVLFASSLIPSPLPLPLPLTLNC